MKYFCIAILLLSTYASFGFTNSNFGFHTIHQASPDSSVRKSVLKLKGKVVQRQVYFNYLKCKSCRSQLIGSSVFIGLGAIALAGSIPLLTQGVQFSTSKQQVSSSTGIVLAAFSVFALGYGIPFTILNSKEYKTKYNGKCTYQTVYLLPQLTGLTFALKF